MEEQKNFNEVISKIKKSPKISSQYLYLADDGLIEKVGSVFKLCNLSSMRAIELAKDMPKLVDAQTSKFSSIAMEEIKQGVVNIKKAS